MIRQTQPGLWVETRAIRPAHRLEGQCQHYRISDERFKIHVVVLNLILESFPRMIREKLLELDSDRQGDVDEAPAALPLGRRVDVGGHQDALVHRLEPEVDLDLGTLAHADETLAERLGGRDVESLLAHLAGLVEEVANIHAERGLLEGHDRRFYAPRGTARPSASRPAARSERGSSAASARRDAGASARRAADAIARSRARSVRADVSAGVAGP